MYQLASLSGYVLFVLVIRTAPPLKKIQEGIRNLLRQIVSSVTFLPVIESKCKF